MKPRFLPNGILLIPKRAESEDGRVIGDGMVEVEPRTPEYEAWIPSARTRLPHHARHGHSLSRSNIIENRVDDEHLL